ncbi:MAG: hypothetical protein HY701_14815, partial [Gemmatimonadetes bacterium]|nr:hypothetical protein [Gemmatimonadota bacterium]
AHGHAAGDGWVYGTVAEALLTHGSTPILVFQDAPRRKPPQPPRQNHWVRQRASRTDQAWVT